MNANNVMMLTIKIIIMLTNNMILKFTLKFFDINTFILLHDKNFQIHKKLMAEVTKF